MKINETGGDLQFSAAMPAQDSSYHKASPEDLTQYHKDCRDSRISLRASQQIAQLRQDRDRDERGQERTLILAFDGGYANSTVWKSMPRHTACIGRIRKDARLCFTPDPA